MGRQDKAQSRDVGRPAFLIHSRKRSQGVGIHHRARQGGVANEPLQKESLIGLRGEVSPTGPHGERVIVAPRLIRLRGIREDRFRDSARSTEARRLGHHERDESASGAVGGAGSENRRVRIAVATAQDSGVPVSALVALALPRLGKQSTHLRRSEEFNAVRRLLFVGGEKVVGDADIGNREVPDVALRRSLREASLGSREGDRSVRPDGFAGGNAGIGIQSARDVNREHGALGTVDPVNRLCHHASRSTLRTNAEQRIENQRPPREHRRVEPSIILKLFFGKHAGRDGRLMLKILPRTRRIALQPRRHAGEQARHVKPFALETRRRHEAIAPVVPRPAEHNDTLRPHALCHRRRHSSHRRARPAHRRVGREVALSKGDRLGFTDSGNADPLHGRPPLASFPFCSRIHANRRAMVSSYPAPLGR